MGENTVECVQPKQQTLLDRVVTLAERTAAINNKVEELFTYVTGVKLEESVRSNTPDESGLIPAINRLEAAIIQLRDNIATLYGGLM